MVRWEDIKPPFDFESQERAFEIAEGLAEDLVEYGEAIYIIKTDKDEKVWPFLEKIILKHKNLTYKKEENEVLIKVKENEVQSDEEE